MAAMNLFSDSGSIVWVLAMRSKYIEQAHPSVDFGKYLDLTTAPLLPRIEVSPIAQIVP